MPRPPIYSLHKVGRQGLGAPRASRKIDPQDFSFPTKHNAPPSEMGFSCQSGQFRLGEDWPVGADILAPHVAAAAFSYAAFHPHLQREKDVFVLKSQVLQHR